MNAKSEARLSGKSVLVTGGSRGIGRAIALRLGAEGAAFVGVHYSNRSAEAEAVVQSLHANGVRAIALPSTFSPDGATAAAELWTSFARASQEELGHDHLDILVNCAGIVLQADLAHTTLEAFRHMVSVNLEAPFFLIQAASPHMRAGGRIINLSTALTRIAAPDRAIYAASKGAINALTLALAADFGPKGITVNAVAPGVIETDMNSDWLHNANARKQAEDLSVFSRVGTAEDVAGVVAFLASKDGQWTTGQVIDSSGGSRI